MRINTIIEFGSTIMFFYRVVGQASEIEPTTYNDIAEEKGIYYG